MTSPATPPTDFGTQITALLSRPPNVEGIDLSADYFSAPVPRLLLPDGHDWQPPGAAKPKVPLQLCEFLAYKCSLAYESEKRIMTYLVQCCDGIYDPTFFQSVKTGAQAFAFVFQNKAYVIFRGTDSESNADWIINRSDAMTDTLGDKTDRRHRKLAKLYGNLLDQLGPATPGRHAGFSIAWASVKRDIDAWLEKASLSGVTGIIYSGHSLGGAMAQLAAYDRACNVGREQIAGVVTFGAPMVGNSDFAADYKDRLGTRTVLLESSGDLVPRIMQRWYFRMLYPLRQKAKAGLNLQLQQTQLGFASVSQPWRFANEPPLSNADITNALNSIRYAAERADKALREAQVRADKQKAKQEAAKDPQNTTSPTDGKTDAAKAPKTTSEGAPSWLYWAVGGVVIIVVAGVAWYFIRRKLFSHDIQQRYALYLSTLSYQQLRAKHAGDLDSANRDLDAHLAFIRGRLPESRKVDNGKAYFDTVQNLPLKVSPKQDSDYVKYLQNSSTFI